MRRRVRWRDRRNESSSGSVLAGGPQVKRVIAPKALDRFKYRIREVTRRAKGVSIEATVEELAPLSAGLAQLLRLLRNARGADWLNPLGAAKTSGIALWRQWKTPRRRRAALLQLGVRPRLASNTASRRPRPLVPCPRQGPLGRALQCVLQIAWTSDSLIDGVLAQPTRTAVYGPVRTVVWQGSAGDRRPYADLVGSPEMSVRGPETP